MRWDELGVGGSAAMAMADAAGSSELQRMLIALSRDVRELSLGCTSDVARIHGAPDPLRFLRDFVLPNRPCIITDAISHWPALTLWSNPYLLRQLAHCDVSCHFTPNGRADAIVRPQPQVLLQSQPFSQAQAQAQSASQSQIQAESQAQAISEFQPQTLAESQPQAHSQSNSQSLAESQAQCQFQAVSQPLAQCQGPAQSDVGVRGPVLASALVEELPFAEALEHVLASTSGHQVAYLQQQNDCFSSEFAALAGDADAEIAWASEALGCKPEAVNLWIGSPESVTSFHKDHYENLYAVVSGEKHFTLVPPTDVHRMYVREYPTAHYKRTVCLSVSFHFHFPFEMGFSHL